MGRTVPSFRITLEMEKAEWKPFRNALDKKDRKEFDDIWDIPRLYITACSNSVSLVPLHPIAMSILFHHYKDLMQLKALVEQIDAKPHSIKKEGLLTIKEEVEREEKKEIPATLDSYINKSNTSYSKSVMTS
jgi:hypothetical protein